jgi:phosphoribosylformylglycinamidine synthase
MINTYELDAVSSGLRFVVRGNNLNIDLMKLLAKRLFANDVIQYYALGTIAPSFPQDTQASGQVQQLALRDKTDSQLMALSHDRRAALNLEEMQTIQAYCEREGRELTDVEFEMIAQTWSEHCVHKTFKAQVQVKNPNPDDNRFLNEYTHLFNQTIRAATQQLNKPWVLSAFRDNAGIIEFGPSHDLSFKVETHNHPSAIEPFGGANTGIGGVIRDVIGVSAKPIAATDILCFGPQDQSADSLPDGVLHPRRIASGVVSGIQDYGNKMGIPTVNGAIYYDPGYTANPLVFCGCIGLAPRDSHPRDVQPDDHIIVLGGRTGRDGLRGATFSSMTMDAQTGEVSGASVQIGAPIVEKGLVDVLMEARDQRLYNAITDCGAGGLSSAVGEMASECGGEVQLEDVPLKYPGLEPWEIWLSEAQERMVIAVPEQNLEALQDICDKYDVESNNIGQFNTSGRIRVYYQDQVVLDLDNQFLHHGIPQRKLHAEIRVPQHAPGWLNPAVDFSLFKPEESLLKLLAHPNISSKEAVIRVYDHEVQGGTVVKPLNGVMDDGPADGCVIKPLAVKGEQAFVISAGINPEYARQNPYQMTINVIDEAVRNALCCGVDPDQVAILDNFCWGDPMRVETMGDLVQSAQACYDGALRYGTPFVSGKDSFNNEYLGSDGLRHAIPPTLLISAMGVIPDWRLALTSDLKQAGNLLYLVGYFSPRFGGSHHNLIDANQRVEEGMPVCHPDTPTVYRRVYQANQAGWLRSAHDLSEGGLAVSAAEMSIGGRLGLQLTLDGQNAFREAFGETAGCILLEVATHHQTNFEELFRDFPLRKLGEVIAEPYLEIRTEQGIFLQLSMEQLVDAWKYQRIAEVNA